jgi:S-adenosylhomocysteine hydrolase
MNGSPLYPIQITVFDKVSIEKDLSASVIRRYTFVNESDKQTRIELARTEEFNPPVKDFKCTSASEDIQIIPLLSEEITKVAWTLLPKELAPDEEIVVEFSFKRPFFKVEPPLIASFEYISAERITYSIEITTDLPELFSLCEVTVTPAPIDSRMESFNINQQGHLIISPRRLSLNKGGKLSLTINSNPPKVETLPLLRYLANQNKGRVSLEDLTVIIIPHLLTDFLSLIDALEEIGLDPDSTFIIGIPYSLKQHVVIRLWDRGYKNILAPLEYPFEKELDEVIEAAVKSAQSKGGKILVIEDGGYIVPRLHTHYPEYIPLFIGAVEQTANGIWAYQDIPESERKLTNINVAESDLKKRRESPLIGDAVYMNVSRLLDNVAKVSARDRDVLIVGFGSTGSRVAELFSKNGAKVTIYDQIESRREEARGAGFTVADDLDSAIKGKFLVVGCTGKVSIGISSLLRADHRTIFVNASSKRLEVNHTELQNATLDTDSKRGVTTYHLVIEKDLLILANGYPVNFHDTESVPDKELQFIYGLIFAAAVYLIQNPSLPTDIVDVPEDIQTSIESLHNATR